jgi:hypothetical protein
MGGSTRKLIGLDGVQYGSIIPLNPTFFLWSTGIIGFGLTDALNVSAPLAVIIGGLLGIVAMKTGME